MKGVDIKKNSCSYDLSSVCAVEWVRADWIRIPRRWRFVGSFPNSMERGEVNFGIWRAVRFRIRSVGAGTDIETFFDMQM